MTSYFKINMVRYYGRAGYSERLRLTKPFSKERAFKETGPMTRFTIESWIRRSNYGIALLVGNGVLVVDKDGPEQGPFQGLESCCVSVSSRGTHHWFRTDIERGKNLIKAGGHDVDLIVNDNSIVAVPPSEMETGMLREWRQPLKPIPELPQFPRELYEQFLTPKTGTAIKPVIDIDDQRRIERARRYIARIVAVAGSGGDTQTFRAACALIQKFRLSVEQALPLLLEWDQTNAVPPWNDIKRLRYKLEQALKLRA